MTHFKSSTEAEGLLFSWVHVMFSCVHHRLEKFNRREGGLVPLGVFIYDDVETLEIRAQGLSAEKRVLALRCDLNRKARFTLGLRQINV